MRTIKWVALAGLTTGVLFAGLGGCGVWGLAAAGLGAVFVLTNTNLFGTGT